MSEQPLVSIVTPSLNQGKFIRATIDSILSQDYKNIEYLVMDGGSTDETLDILRSYGSRIRWVSEADSGQSQAVNKGWQCAQGAILGWVNADDLLLPGAVEQAVKALQDDESLGGVYGDCAYIDENGAWLRAYPTKAFDYASLVCETEDFIPQPTVFLRQSVAEQAGFLDERLHYVMDYDFWLRIGVFAPLKYLPTEMGCLRLHSDAKTVRAVPLFAPEMAFIFERLTSRPDFPEQLQNEKMGIVRQAYIHAASFCFWGGETRQARKYLYKAWKARPYPRGRTFYRLLAFALLGKMGWKIAQVLHGNPFVER